MGTGQADSRQRRAGSAQRWINAALACTFFVAREVPALPRARRAVRRAGGGAASSGTATMSSHPGALVSHPNLPVRPRLLWHAFDVLVLKQFVRPAGRRLAIDLIHFPS